MSFTFIESLKENARIIRPSSIAVAGTMNAFKTLVSKSRRTFVKSHSSVKGIITISFRGCRRRRRRRCISKYFAWSLGRLSSLIEFTFVSFLFQKQV
jgi:hypothetical protein